VPVVPPESEPLASVPVSLPEPVSLPDVPVSLPDVPVSLPDVPVSRPVVVGAVSTFPVSPVLVSSGHGGFSEVSVKKHPVDAETVTTSGSAMARRRALLEAMSTVVPVDPVSITGLD
jgi:hypothetical protein